jgi:hypothetical protein
VCHLEIHKTTNFQVSVKQSLTLHEEYNLQASETKVLRKTDMHHAYKISIVKHQRKRRIGRPR